MAGKKLGARWQYWVDRTIQRLYTGMRMTPRRKYSFWIDEDQVEGLRFIKERDGVLESEQIRRAIDAWLEEKGVKRADRRRAQTRRRP
jgi:hypothetical protein